MADKSGSQDVGDRKIIKVTVKTPRDKKEVDIDSSVTVKEVTFFCLL
jgi:hypothetical protein